MATHRSAEKRHRQSERRRARNISTKSHVKTRIKSLIAAIEAKDSDGAGEKLLTATKAIDKAVGKGIIHKKTASRKISRLTRKVNALLTV
ncbi:MAG: 30S ribosomal protein S20 [Syntrophales bacterium]|nr:30S ribosomal protein S20 [Syntrophales bacterium]MCK9528475.1 30S ribosomal protein S20 [Syntrophales bacterium]MDX9923012.1 30S ribosomal protein S20 [Syntrophales bacterium]